MILDLSQKRNNISLSQVELKINGNFSRYVGVKFTVRQRSFCDENKIKDRDHLYLYLSDVSEDGTAELKCSGLANALFEPYEEFDATRFIYFKPTPNDQKRMVHDQYVDVVLGLPSRPTEKELQQFGEFLYIDEKGYLKYRNRYFSHSQGKPLSRFVLDMDDDSKMKPMLSPNEYEFTGVKR